MAPEIKLLYLMIVSASAFHFTKTQSSKFPGLVLGFQIPARMILTEAIEAKSFAIAMICSSVSALQGPDINKGLLFQISLTIDSNIYY